MRAKSVQCVPRPFLLGRPPMTRPEPPQLAAYRLEGAPGVLVVWCDWCRRWHQHGAGGGGGHRVAHCAHRGGPYRDGYVLRVRGTRTLEQLRGGCRRAQSEPRALAGGG